MKKIILILMLVSGLFASQELKLKEVAFVKRFVENRTVYETCYRNRLYIMVDTGYNSAFATVWEEIDHPVLGKIDQPVKCEE